MKKILPSKSQLNIEFRIDKSKVGKAPATNVNKFLSIGILFLDKNGQVIKQKVYDEQTKPNSEQGLMLKKSKAGYLLILKKIPKEVISIKCMVGIKNPNKQYRFLSDYPICEVTVSRVDELENKQFLLYNFNYENEKLATVTLLHKTKEEEWILSKNLPSFYKDSYEKAKLNIRKELKNY